MLRPRLQCDRMWGSIGRGAMHPCLFYCTPYLLYVGLQRRYDTWHLCAALLRVLAGVSFPRSFRSGTADLSHLLQARDNREAIRACMSVVDEVVDKNETIRMQDTTAGEWPRRCMVQASLPKRK